jgi:hypothetical protein
LSSCRSTRRLAVLTSYTDSGLSFSIIFSEGPALASLVLGFGLERVLQVFDVFQKLDHGLILFWGEEKALDLVVLKQPRWLGCKHLEQNLEPGFGNSYGFHGACLPDLSL